jgi:methylenetetrahydrofolate reductase (NADPH)
VRSADALDESIAQAIIQFARDASIEINVQDVKDLDASRAFLSPGKKLYVSHLLKQGWKNTEATCRAVRDAGFDPVPHVPVRLLADAEALDRTLARFIAAAQVQEVLLISGDYPEALGPYPTVGHVLRSGAMQRHGLTRVSVAGHPEGHPTVPLEDIRRAEREKVMLATNAGLEVTLLTQFFFEKTPFLEWVNELRADGIRAHIIAGLAGPARLATLFKYAMRCGAGPSMRALGTRPKSLMKLLGDHGPDDVIRGLAQARISGESGFNGIHLFCFGGYLRTCEWLFRVAEGHFNLNDRDGFSV